MKRSKPLRRTGTPTRKTRVRKVNRARKAREFARTYGSKERVEFVKTLPCAVHMRRFRGSLGWGIAHCIGPIENAHIEGGGASRKADADKVVPLCRVHHKLLHRIGRPAFEDQYGVSLHYIAGETERLSRLAFSGAQDT